MILPVLGGISGWYKIQWNMLVKSGVQPYFQLGRAASFRRPPPRYNYLNPGVEMSDTPDSKLLMRSIIQRIATGPELSKDIAQEEARAGMRAILQGHISPVQTAIFLIALRMKRETHEEFRGVLDGIRDVTESVVAPVEEVLDIADPYDGYNRTLPAAPFLPAVLACCGVHGVSHGMETVGPKFGCTHRQILRAAGVPVDLPVEEAAARLGNPGIGWTYVDQSRFCKPLNDLLDFRTEMVKRSPITTVEVLTGPIRGRRKTHLATGFVHKPYPPIYAMLARHSGYDSALLIRGVEGGVVPSLRQTGKFFYYRNKATDELLELDVEPSTLGIRQELRAAPLPPDLPGSKLKGDEIMVGVDTSAMAQAAAEAGKAVLGGQSGPLYDALVYAGAMCLWHLKRAETLQAGAEKIRQVLDSGEALARLK
jgi:anthranilate phosphoribosyltransferase